MQNFYFFCNFWQNLTQNKVRELFFELRTSLNFQFTIQNANFRTRDKFECISRLKTSSISSTWWRWPWMSSPGCSIARWVYCWVLTFQIVQYLTDEIVEAGIILENPKSTIMQIAYQRLAKQNRREYLLLDLGALVGGIGGSLGIFIGISLLEAIHALLKSINFFQRYK